MCKDLVSFAVEFHAESCFVAIEVEDIGSEGVLPSKVKTQSIGSEALP